MINPIRVTLLWHQHQPYYRAGNEFLMPWAWLHATKDYLEMAEHFERHPEMHGTINLVPSLLLQIEEYLSGTAHDPVVELMSKSAKALSASEKEQMLDNFFYAHRERVIDRSPRFRELFEAAQGPNREKRFALQDYRDLAVHYSLAWTGEIARMREPFKSLIEQDRDYSENDKKALAQAQIENVRRIVPLHKELAKRGQIELSTSPFYHPILPLLIDTDSARETMPDVKLPKNRFHAPEEAENQSVQAQKYFAEKVGANPNGMWPSEGSLSAAALSLIRKKGFAWTASDESVLANSLAGKTIPAGEKQIRPEHARFFPWRFDTESGEITI
ncbi:MAG TPA: glycoside hydrolase, partial [Candidatus Kapabacteria bacterium]|nr:glycoside hydrolase [Candidatus Kapabacteria bacterium]